MGISHRISHTRPKRGKRAVWLYRSISRHNPSPSQGGGFELIRLRTGLVLSGRDAQNNQAQVDQMGHLKTPSVVPSSVVTSPALKQPASKGGILEPMCVVKLFELCAPVVKTTTKAASESRVTSSTRIEERGETTSLDITPCQVRQNLSATAVAWWRCNEPGKELKFQSQCRQQLDLDEAPTRIQHHCTGIGCIKPESKSHSITNANKAFNPRDFHQFSDSERNCSEIPRRQTRVTPLPCGNPCGWKNPAPHSPSSNDGLCARREIWLFTQYSCTS